MCGQDAPDCGDAGLECNWAEGVCSRCTSLAAGVCCTGDTHCCLDFSSMPYQPFCEQSSVSCPAGPPGPLEGGS